MSTKCRIMAIRTFVVCIVPLLMCCSGGTRTELFTAVEKKDVERVRDLLGKRVDLDAANEDRETLLTIAVSRGNHQIVELLIEHGADVNATGDKSISPLMLASGLGHPDTVRLLIGNGADVTHTDRDNATALHFAASSGDQTVAGLLFDAGIDVGAGAKDGTTALMVASLGGYTDFVRALIEAGADIHDDGQETARQNRHGLSLQGRLSFAFLAGMDKMETVEYVTDAELKEALHQPFFKPSLLYAIEGGQVETAKVLIEAGADISWALPEGTDQFFSGMNTLMYAAFCGHTEMMEFLLSSGIPIDARDSWDNTAFRYAIDGDSADAVRLLIEHGSRFMEFQDGYTDLMHAAAYGSEKVAAALLELQSSGHDAHTGKLF